MNYRATFFVWKFQIHIYKHVFFYIFHQKNVLQSIYRIYSYGGMLFAVSMDIHYELSEYPFSLPVSHLYIW